MSDLLAELRQHERQYPSLIHAELCGQAADRIEALVKALEALANAEALIGIRTVVAGWNGEDRPEPYQHRHPDNLGSTPIKTRCKAVYDLDDALKAARLLLASVPEVGERGNG